MANDRLGGVAGSVGEAGARDGDGDGAGTSGYWTNVLQQIVDGREEGIL